MPSVLDADFIVFDGTCGDRQQVLALDIVHVVDDSVDALFRSGFKVSAIEHTVRERSEKDLWLRRQKTLKYCIQQCVLRARLGH